MKNILVVLAFIITSSALAQDWTNYDNKDYNFSINFPGEPETMAQEVPTEVGDLTMTMFVVDTSSNENSSNLMYMVIHTQYPVNPDKVEESKLQTMLDGSVDGAVGNVQGKLVYANKVELNSNPGREVKIEVQGAYLYMNMYIMDGALYAIQTICLVENDKNEDINKFLSSFKLNKVE